VLSTRPLLKNGDEEIYRCWDHLGAIDERGLIPGEAKPNKTLLITRHICARSPINLLTNCEDKIVPSLLNRNGRKWLSLTFKSTYLFKVNINWAVNRLYKKFYWSINTKLLFDIACFVLLFVLCLFFCNFLDKSIYSVGLEEYVAVKLSSFEIVDVNPWFKSNYETNKQCRASFCSGT